MKIFYEFLSDSTVRFHPFSNFNLDNELSPMSHGPLDSPYSDDYNKKTLGISEDRSIMDSSTDIRFPRNLAYKHQILDEIDKPNIFDLPCMFCPNPASEGSTAVSASVEKYENIIERNLDKKYLTSRDYYNSKVITDIIYNESTNLVSVFKDYLIFDDVSEFLKRDYDREE